MIRAAVERGVTFIDTAEAFVHIPNEDETRGGPQEQFGMRGEIDRTFHRFKSKFFASLMLTTHFDVLPQTLGNQIFRNGAANFMRQH